MGDWTVCTRLHVTPLRWLNHQGDGIEDWVADPETTRLLSDTPFVFPLTLTGPWCDGIRTESDLYAAALYIIPAATTAGEVPPYPDLPPLIEGAVY